MSKMLYVIAKFTGQKRSSSSAVILKSFNFKGYYNGHLLSSIALDCDDVLEKGESYLIYGREIKFDEKCLEIKMIWLEKLDSAKRIL